MRAGRRDRRRIWRGDPQSLPGPIALPTRVDVVRRVQESTWLGPPLAPSGVARESRHSCGTAPEWTAFAGFTGFATWHAARTGLPGSGEMYSTTRGGRPPVTPRWQRFPGDTPGPPGKCIGQAARGSERATRAAQGVEHARSAAIFRGGAPPYPPMVQEANPAGRVGRADRRRDAHHDVGADPPHARHRVGTALRLLGHPHRGSPAGARPGRRPVHAADGPRLAARHRGDPHARRRRHQRPGPVTAHPRPGQPAPGGMADRRAVPDRAVLRGAIRRRRAGRAPRGLVAQARPARGRRGMRAVERLGAVGPSGGCRGRRVAAVRGAGAVQRPPGPGGP